MSEKPRELRVGDRIRVYDEGQARLMYVIGEIYDGEFGTVTAIHEGEPVVHWDMTDTSSPWTENYEVVSDE